MVKEYRVISEKKEGKIEHSYYAGRRVYTIADGMINPLRFIAKRHDEMFDKVNILSRLETKLNTIKLPQNGN